MFNKNVDKENSVLPSKKKPYACRIKLDPRIKPFFYKTICFFTISVTRAVDMVSFSPHYWNDTKSYVHRLDFAFTKSSRFRNTATIRSEWKQGKARQSKAKEDEKWCAAGFLERLSIHSLNWGTVYIFNNLGVPGKKRRGDGIKT